MRTNMKREYAAVPKGGSQPRSQFDIGARHLTSMYGGFLVPFYWNWVFPGDVVRGNYSAFVRGSSPLEFPVFDNLHLTIHSFFVPLRICWDNARKFMGEQDSPGDSIDYTLPYLSSTTNIDTNNLTAYGSYSGLMRYLGVPARTSAQGGINGTEVGAFPFRAYNQIHHHEYRDQNQVTATVLNTDDGPDNVADYQVEARGKRHDYFTSLLSAPQKGDAVPVSMDTRVNLGPGLEPTVMRESDGLYYELDSGAAQVDISATTGTAAAALHTELLITDLRNAAAIQQFLERDNRYGSRFDEVIYAHYGVEFNEPRYRPVYLGGGSGQIQSTPIANQSGSTGELGDLAAIATGTLSGAGFTYAVDEPGLIMAIASITADLTYSQGLEYKHRLQTRYDLMWPEFQGIGDRAVDTSEIYYQNNATDDVVLGYTPRYEEFRTSVNRTSMMFDPVHYSGDLGVMHLQEEFTSAPVLGSIFIAASKTPFARIMRTTIEHHFLADFDADIKVARQLSVSGIPGIGRL